MEMEREVEMELQFRNVLSIDLSFGLSLCAVPFYPNVGQFQSEAETEQSMKVPRLHKAVLVRSSESRAGNRVEGAGDAVRGKDEIF